MVSCPPVAVPSLAHYAELIHHGTRGAVPAVVSLGAGAGDSVSVRAWLFPEASGHPADPLVGFVAPRSWDAIGLVATGTVRALPGARPPSHDLAGPSQVTTLMARDGRSVSVLDGPGPATTVLGEPPEGWVADALARCLRRPTPAPVEPSVAWVEASWLDRIAPAVLARPGDRFSWRWLADQHPLAGGRPHPEPTDLAARSFTYALDHPWSLLRRRFAASAVAAVDAAHPGAVSEAIDPADWFDDGSFCRWTMRRLPPAELLLGDLLAVLPDDLADMVVEALVTVPPDARIGP